MTTKRHAHVTGLAVLAFGLFWVPVIVFAAIADRVAERAPLPFDAPVQAAAHAIHTPVLTNLFLLVTSLGQPLVLGGAGLIALVALLLRRYYREAALLLAGLGGAVLANLLLKVVFARARPTQYASVITETSYSFPSGHAMVSSAAVITVIILLWRTKYRAPALVLGLLATFAIGLSRVYLGVHYPSDVLAGWCVGAVWALAAGSIVLDRPLRLGKRLTPGRLGA